MSHTHPSPLQNRRLPLAAALATALLSLAACGGGGGDDDDTPPTTNPQQPSAIQLSGTVVIDQTVSQATVCVDLNKNGACDSSEPKSTATAIDGRYTINYQPTDAAAATTFNAAPLLAQIPATAKDASDPTGDTVVRTAIVLAAPAGKTQINPLTTLVQKGVTGGMTLANAETAVSHQLGTTVAKLYDYQGDLSSDRPYLPDTARTAALITIAAMELGVTPEVIGADVAAVPSSTLSLLNYTDANNFSYRLRQTNGQPDSNGYMQVFETRTGTSSGTATSQATLFNTTRLSLSPTGWRSCDSTVPLLSARGNPGRTTQCQATLTYLGFTTSTVSIAGRTMASVVQDVQSSAGNPLPGEATASISLNLDPTLLGTATFPQGSTLRTAVSVQLGTGQPPYINNVGTDAVGTFTTLEQLIAGRPIGSVNLSNGNGTSGGMGQPGATQILRVAFGPSNAAQFYTCTYAAATGTTPESISNCVAQPSATTYTIATVNGTRLLRFASFPGATSTSETRGYTENASKVYAFRQAAAFQEPPEGQPHPAITYNQRINATAWTAMKATLGIADTAAN